MKLRGFPVFENPVYTEFLGFTSLWGVPTLIYDA